MIHRAFLLLFGLAPLWAQIQPLPPAKTAFRAYGVDSGLENLAIWSLMQDQQGFLWAATEEGVARYDGHRFQSFGMAHGLPSGEIATLHQDPSGTIWVGTYKGLARWEEGRFVPAPLPPLPVEVIQTGPEGRIWLTTSEGPYRQEADGTFKKVPGWPGGEASALWVAPSLAKVWVASSHVVSGQAETDVWEYQSGGWQRIPCQGGFQGARLDALAGDHRGRLWARSNSRLWVLPPGQERFEPAQTPPIVAGSRGFLGVDRKGRLWVPTNRALLRMDEDTWEAYGTRQGFPTDFARAIAEDREGNLWIAGVGAYRRLGRGMLSSYTVSEGLPSNIIWTLHRDRQQRLWVGTDRGVAMATAKGWEILPGSDQMVVRCITEDRLGRLYLAGNTQEILRVDPQTRRVERFPIQVGRPTKRIFRMAIDESNRLWIATESAGLLQGNPQAATLGLHPVTLPEGTATERFSDIFQDRKGRLWACGTQGLALLDRDQWKRFGVKDGLRENHVSYARPTPNGDLLVSYFEPLGLSRVRLESGAIRVLQHLDAKDGLSSPLIYLMGEDSQGRLWVGTGRGVDLISQGGVEHFGSMDGLPSDDCNAMAFLADPNGDVWIGTSGGLARFETRLYSGIPAPPTAALVSVRAGSGTLPTRPARSVQIPYAQNTLEFRFAGLSFLSEIQVEHQVRLVGLEDEWRTTLAREARYPALARGHYRFEVRARIGRGPWSQPLSYAFEVLAPWWQRWWFYLATILLGGSGILAVIRWRIATLRRHNRELEAVVSARTQELKAANEALRNQSLTDPLTGLRNRRYLGVSLPEDVALVNRTHRNMGMGQGDRLASNIDLLFFMVDIDHFKAINDEHGHHAGDLVLQQVAEVLRIATRDSDTVVRWGGEEFLVVARNACRKDAPVVAERIRSMVSTHLFDLGDGHSDHRSCSVGFASYPLSERVPELFNWEQVVDLADQCLYAAKRSGRNAWVGIELASEPKLLAHYRTGFVSVESLVEEGVLELITSLPPDHPMTWKSQQG